MNTTQSIHGHEVLHLLIETPCTRAQLEAELTRRFGADLRFHTCSAQELTLDDLLGFLTAKGKIMQTEAGLLTSDPSRVCNHG